MARLVSALAVLSAVLVLAAAGWVVNEARPGGAHHPAVAAVDRAAGDVSWRPAGAPGWHPATSGQPLAAGDTLRTGAAGRAVAHAISGLAFALGPGTRLALGAPAPGGRGRLAIPVQILAGEVRGVLGAASTQPALALQGASGQTVAELAAAAGAGPTRYRIRVAQGHTEVALLAGAATLTAGGRDVPLAAGQAVVLGGAEGTPSPLALPPAPVSDAPAVDALLDLSGAGKAAVPLAWEAVPGATRYHLEVARSPAFDELESDLRLADPHATFRPRDTGTFAWRVAALDAAGHEGPFGGARRFTVTALPAPEGAPAASPPAAKAGKKAPPVPLPALTLAPAGRGTRLVATVLGRGLSRQPGGRGTPERLRGSVRLGPHDVLTADHSAGLRLGRDLVLGLEEGSHLTVEGTGGGKQGPFLALRLAGGAVTADLGGPAPVRTVYLENGHARVALAAGDGGVRVRASQHDGTLRVVAERGNAEVLVGSTTLPLPEGQGVSVPDDGDPGTPVTLPGAPPLVSPRAGARFATDGSPPAIELKWEQVEGASGYQVRISHDPQGTAVAYQGLSQSTMLVDNGLAPGTYYWTVRALDPRGFSSAAVPARRLVVGRAAVPAAAVGAAPAPAAAKSGPATPAPTTTP